MSFHTDFAWPQRGKKLFLPDSEYHAVSNFGRGGLRYQLVGYMDGYRAAADSSVDCAIGSRDISILDTIVFPIFFLYRQYLELVMKYVYLSFSRTSRQEKALALNAAGHDLLQIWSKVKPLLLEQATEGEAKDVQAVGDYVEQFQAIDRTSFTLRYPMTKDLVLVLTNERNISLPNLRDRMEELANFFDEASAKLDAITEIEAELSQEYLSFFG